MALCPDLAEMTLIPAEREKMLENRAVHHIGAPYLTNRSRVVVDSLPERCLGRLATFIATFFASTTLFKSPHLSRSATDGSSTRVSRAPDYEDYNANWATICTQYHRVSAQSYSQGEKLMNALAQSGLLDTVVCQDSAVYTAILGATSGGHAMTRAASFKELLSRMETQ